jgi:hypothetical protein
VTDFDKAIEETWPKSALSEALPFESWERLAGETLRGVLGVLRLPRLRG